MAIYHLPDGPVNATSIPISGRFLAHTHSSPIERAFIAVDLYSGERQLVLPTMTQAARLARINVTYAWWAAKRLEERAAIEAGMIPLVPPHLAVEPDTRALPRTEDPSQPCETSGFYRRDQIQKANGKALPAASVLLDAPVDAWALAKGLVETFGPAVVFDTVIAPAIA
jgi:hypothetical protein